MSETPPIAPSQTEPLRAGASPDLRALVIVCYFLFVLACVNGVTALFGVVIAHMRRKEAVGTVWQSHFENLIFVFWIVVAAVLIAMLSWPLGIWTAIGSLVVTGSGVSFLWPGWLFAFPFVFGFVVLPVLVVWYFYRTIRGLVRAAESRPYRD